MQIDWLTVIAQIVNFLILVWLLKRFLYQPVIRAMDTRERGIAAHLEEAELREQTATETTQEYHRKMDALERDRDGFLEQASEAAEVTRRDLLDEARSEVAEQRADWQRRVADEKEEFLRNLKYRAAESIQVMARRSLADLANADLEEHIVRSFLQQLKSPNADLNFGMFAADESVQITTSFALDSSLRSQVTRAVHEYIGESRAIVFTESPDLVCGIELTTSGHRVSWTLAHYLAELDQHMREQLEAGSDENR